MPTLREPSPVNTQRPITTYRSREGSYFRCDPMQDSRKRRYIGVEKPHDFTAHARESSVKSVGVSGIALNKKLEDCRMTADEILRNCD